MNSLEKNNRETREQNLLTVDKVIAIHLTHSQEAVHLSQEVVKVTAIQKEKVATQKIQETVTVKGSPR